ncbi:C4-dicarboxylate-specific signal transduction histidine kinase [Ulvibacter sp. MAR_2010_11]|uniref:two-component regulator propeller domain-containing protein n=1 Tax=Ulvibacter sp. MAR_2010_11 TaxID=1250229 RepID=UPI000C2C2C5B|nr:two-component regulator propeller domain-containing protein [Ulvibacter sp. MAR_2010_11]PKA83102.1 C4-dicarboxylate-specific signal transduction histidine kinase [Ulvibacter sp. MAR_2010_11]
MKKYQNSVNSFLCFIILLALSACNTSPRNVPFPLQESEFTTPTTEKLSFSELQKFEWITVDQDSVEPAKSEKFDLDKIPSKPINLGNPIPMSQPMVETAFDLKSFPDEAFNLETMPSQELKFKINVLGQPMRTKSGIPRLNDGASESLLKFGLDQGLSGSVYSDFKQDKNGIIWIATDDGLNRFDGEYCETYSLPQGLLASWINQIIIDKQEQLWIRYSGNRGVSVINRKTGVIKHISSAEGLSEGNIRWMEEDEKGRIWICTNNGLNIIDQRAGTIKKITDEQGLAHNNSGLVFQDGKGRIWLSMQGSGVDIIDEKAGTIKHIDRFLGVAANTIISISEDKQGRIWFGTWASGIMMFDENAGVIKQISSEQGLSNNRIYDLAIDEKDRVWIATDGSGVYVFDEKSLTMQQFNTTRGLNNDNALSIFADNQHQIWIGMNGGEANIYNTSGGNIHHLTSSSGLSNKTSFYYGFTQDNQSRIWVSSIGGSGMDIIDEKNGTYKTVSTKNGLWGNNISYLFTDDRNRIWVDARLKFGGRSKVAIIDQKAGIISHLGPEQGISTWNTGAIFQDSKEQMWISRKGIYVINEKNESIKNLPFDRGLSGYVHSIIEDNNGLIWAGTINGVDVINEKEGTIKHLLIKGLKEFECLNLQKDSHGNIWIGTTGNGLFMASPDAGAITNFTVANGLANDLIYSINERNGAIYVATGKGPTVITPTSNEKDNERTTPTWTLKSYGKPQGFLRVDHNPRSMLAKDGKLWYGIADVLTIMDEPQNDSIVPPTFISGLDIMGRPQNFVTNKHIQSALNETDTIRSVEKDTFYFKNSLPADSGFLIENGIKWDGITGPYNLPVNLFLPYEMNQINFHFTGMHLDNMDKTKYRYILEGADKSWSDISGRASAEYRNLSHGDYTFKVSSSGFNDKWSKPVVFRFTIQSPWWLSTWAYIIYGLCLIALIAAVDTIQRRRLLEREREKTKEKELAQAKEIEKAYNELKTTQAQLIQSEKMASLGELTAGIAHEIQNPLNFVTNFSEVNKELLGEMNEEIANGNLEEVKSIAKNITENEEKINHHGKRADAIVKGMLQHSRSSSGMKELMDINVLADEYLRLAYHGLRAKDKSFNATLETNFDASIEKLEIVPQDIGRVVLNLITNAFYAVTEKKNLPLSQGDNYIPTVSVATKKIKNTVEISIQDNGNGIPKNIVEKIFQPFFTTKPTGQGTGLGLSLSYDIIKAHGGELKVETKETEGTTFTILLPSSQL